MPRNSLTKPSNFSRTQHERRSRSSDQGCAGRRGSGGRLLGTLASWNMMLRRQNAASPARCPNPPSRKNRTGPCPLRRSSLPPMQPSAKAPQQSSPCTRVREVRIQFPPAKRVVQTFGSLYRRAKADRLDTELFKRGSAVAVGNGAIVAFALPSGRV